MNKACEDLKELIEHIEKHKSDYFWRRPKTDPRDLEHIKFCYEIIERLRIALKFMDYDLKILDGKEKN